MSSHEFTVPILPHTAPAAEQPPGLKLPLFPHQLRALNRCLVIEEDGDLSKDFGARYHFHSRGGVLADQVGTGKTATSIGLVLAGDKGNEGDTLVVAPSHLIPQWKAEIIKFTDQVQVVCGEAEYKKTNASSKRRIVLVDVDTILKTDKLWYDFRRVFDPVSNRQVYTDRNTMELYKEAALYSVRSAKGPCNYTGNVYVGPLHLTKRPWRRVIFDEIQDLVAEGTVSQKNLLQLTRTAQHVWLLSATPFPHGNKSVYANHELLGFCRFTPDDHTFEIIKRKLYIRSPRHVADLAVTASKNVTRNTIMVKSMDLERRFYSLELSKIKAALTEANKRGTSLFCPEYFSLREMTVHPEASEGMREAMTGRAKSGTSASVSAAASRSIRTAKQRLAELSRLQNANRMQRQLNNIKMSFQLAEKIQGERANSPLLTSVFAGPVSSDTLDAIQKKEERIIHDHYCGCTAPGSSGCYANGHVEFRVMRQEDTVGPEFLYTTAQVVKYFEDNLSRTNRVHAGHAGQGIPTLQHYITCTRRCFTQRLAALSTLQAEQAQLNKRIEILSLSLKHGASSTADLDSTHGSKPAALIRHLQELDGTQCIVFSYWHDTLKLVKRSLDAMDLHCCFCDGSQTTRALEQFTSGKVPILLLSAQSKASGANLQCASEVIILDPPGNSADHGNTLEQQAIGRAVRMGQDKNVTVTRFCVEGTLEATLFNDIDQARKKGTAKNDNNYVIEGSYSVAKATNLTAMDDEDGAVEMTSTITLEERLENQMKEAEKRGDVITIDSDNDDPDEKRGPDIESDQKVTSPSPANKRKIKAEIVATPVTKVPRVDTTCSTHLAVTAPAPTPTTTQAQTVNAVSPLENESPPPPTMARSKPSDGIHELLQKFELSQYIDVFVDHGYDSVAWLLEIATDDRIVKQVVADVGFKRGHAVRFQHKLVQEARRQIGDSRQAESNTGDESNSGNEKDTSSSPPVISSRAMRAQHRAELLQTAHNTNTN